MLAVVWHVQICGLLLLFNCLVWSGNIMAVTLFFGFSGLLTSKKKSKVQVFDTPQVVNCFMVEFDAVESKSIYFE